MPLPFIAAGSAAPSLHNVAVTVDEALTPILATPTGVTSTMLARSGSNGVYSALPTLGIMPSGGVGQVAQTPEGNVQLPIMPLVGASPTDDIFLAMDTTSGAHADSSETSTSGWREDVRNQASNLANFISSWARTPAERESWDPMVRDLVRFAIESGTASPAELRAKLPALPAGASSYSPAVTAVRDRLATLSASIPVSESSSGYATAIANAGGFGLGFPSGASSEELLDSVGEDIAGGTVTEGTEGEDIAVAVPATSSPSPWLWVLGGAVAVAVVAGGVALARRK